MTTLTAAQRATHDNNPTGSPVDAAAPAVAAPAVAVGRRPAGQARGSKRRRRIRCASGWPYSPILDAFESSVRRCLVFPSDKIFVVTIENTELIPRALTTLSEDERLFQASVYEFADREIRPLVREMDEHAKIPRALIDKLFELGIMAIEIP